MVHNEVGIKEAMYYKSLDGKNVVCNLCPHHCKLAPGQRGLCRVRENRGGKLYTLVYGMASAIHTDPIEKKPLFHFYPGSKVTSFATVGCNMRCLHCQNWDISQADISTLRLHPLDVNTPTQLALAEGASGIAWTYNEPTVWYEYTLAASRVAKKKGLYTVYVSNGYIEKDPLEEISPYLDAMNIDVKAFTDKFYNEISAARLQPVLDTVKRAVKLGIFVELTYLIIPTKNDSTEEIRSFCQWVLDNVGPETAVHFSRFHPDYKLSQLPATPIETMIRARETAMEMGLEYVYLGNVWDSDYESTRCPECGNMLISRDVYSVKVKGLKGRKCDRCGRDIPVVR